MDAADKKDGYKKQQRLTLINLLGEMPNFIALLVSAITTGTILVFVDLIDTGSNVLRNILVVLISKVLRKDLKYKYNYGTGKIEALASMLCDFVMSISLIMIFIFAIKDLVDPGPTDNFIFFVVFVKVLNLAGDFYIFFRQRKICKKSDSLVFRSSLSVALKNLLFDSISLTALVLMGCFQNVKAFWYISPVLSIILGTFLFYKTVNRLKESIGIILDKSADEYTQVTILKALSSLYDKYDIVNNIQSHSSGGKTIVDLELGFKPDLTYKEMKETADSFALEISKTIPNSEISLRITGKADSVLHKLEKNTKIID